MGTASRFDGSYQFGWQGLISSQEFGIFLGKNIIGNDSQGDKLGGQAFRQGQHQSGLATSDRTSNAHGISSFLPILSMMMMMG
jgi:hypothetical protein